MCQCKGSLGWSRHSTNPQFHPLDQNKPLDLQSLSQFILHQYSSLNPFSSPFLSFGPFLCCTTCQFCFTHHFKSFSTKNPNEINTHTPSIQFPWPRFRLSVYPIPYPWDATRRNYNTTQFFSIHVSAEMGLIRQQKSHQVAFGEFPAINKYTGQTPTNSCTEFYILISSHQVIPR